MTLNEFEIIAKDTKQVFCPSREKRGKNTSDLRNLIDEVSEIYQKYYDKNVLPDDISSVLLQISITTMIRKSAYKDTRSYLVHAHGSCKRSLETLNEQCDPSYYD